MTDGQDGSATHSSPSSQAAQAAQTAQAPQETPTPQAAEAVRAAKRALRGEMKQRRAALTEQRRRQAAIDLADRFMAAIAPPPKITIAAFLPIGDEVDILVLLRRLAHAGHACCLPVIAGPDRPLEFHGWQPDTALIDGPHGIGQPRAGAPCQPDLLIVPLLAFDRAGRRLGYGKGYYDRTLAALRRQDHVRAIGAAFSVQEVPAVPTDEFDVGLDGVVTEREAIYPI